MNSNFKLKLYKKYRKVIEKLNILIYRKDKDKEKWRTIKNKYKGKRVFLIGNGPSLNKTPMHLLKDEYTIGFNRINVLFERLNWRPSFYTICDEWVAVDMWDELNEINSEVDFAFYPDVDPHDGISFKKEINKKDNIFWLNLENRGFYSDLPKAGINATVANLGFQILAYLGFEEIYLIGVDMSYSVPKTTKNVDIEKLNSGEDDDPNHFDPRYFGKGRNYSQPRINDLVLPNYHKAKKFLNNKGIKVYNSTIGGKLEVFSRVEFRGLFDFSLNDEVELLLKGFVDNPLSFYKSVEEYKKEDNIDSFLKDSFKVLRIDLAVKLIPKLIFSHIPLGPLNNQCYFFIKR